MTTFICKATVKEMTIIVDKVAVSQGSTVINVDTDVGVIISKQLFKCCSRGEVLRVFSCFHAVSPKRRRVKRLPVGLIWGSVVNLVNRSATQGLSTEWVYAIHRLMGLVDITKCSTLFSLLGRHQGFGPQAPQILNVELHEFNNETHRHDADKMEVWKKKFFCFVIYIYNKI